MRLVVGVKLSGAEVKQTAAIWVHLRTKTRGRARITGDAAESSLNLEDVSPGVRKSENLLMFHNRMVCRRSGRGKYARLTLYTVPGNPGMSRYRTCE